MIINDTAHCHVILAPEECGWILASFSFLPTQWLGTMRTEAANLDPELEVMLCEWWTLPLIIVYFCLFCYIKEKSSSSCLTHSTFA